MKKIILPVLATLIVAGCSDSDGASSLANNDAAPNQDDSVPVSVDVATPPEEVPEGPDELQACVAIDAVEVMDLAGKIVEWTTKSMENPEWINEQYVQCIPNGSDVPVDNDGIPKFIVIDLHNVAGLDLVNLISEQLLPVGEYTSMALSLVKEGDYGDILGTPYSYVGGPYGFNATKMDILEDLKFDGLDINIDVPTTYTMSFDLKSMIQLVGQAYELKNEGFKIVDNLKAGTLWGDIDLSACESAQDPYVYLYESDTPEYGDLGSDYPPIKTAKVGDDNTYEMQYVPEGDYDVVLVCDALLDLPNQIDLDIDLDGDRSYHQGQYISAGEKHYRNL